MSPLWPVLSLLALAAVVSGVALSKIYPLSRPAGAAPEAKFTDVTRASGLLAGWRDSGPPGGEAPSTLPGAVAFLDYDGDGHPDLFFVRAPRWPWDPPPAGAPSSFALYHNDGGGHFTNVTRAAGLDVHMLGMGVAVGDYANEGRPDIFVTGIGGNRLYHNLGNGRFEDVTRAAGVGGDAHVWATGAVWLDLFGDGRLDLVVCNYGRWARETDLRSALRAERAGPSYAMPTGFVSCFPTVYRNLGDGKFVDVTAKSGLDRLDLQTGFPRAFPLAVAGVDANGDGRLDLLFTYQSGDDALFLNRGDGTFRPWTPPADRREGMSAGLAAASGSSFGRPVRDEERLAVLRAAGLALGSSSEANGLECTLRAKLGVALLDYDLDGRVDIFSPNGKAEPALERFEGGRSFAARPSLLWNTGAGWTPARSPGGGWDRPMVARGVAVADVYGNGSLDVAIARNGGPPILLRNDQATHHAWLRIDLVGTRCERDAGGARVEVHTPRRIITQTMEPATGFMAQSERTLTFGLGDDARVNRVVVLWPDGLRQEIRTPQVDRRLVITEPAG